MSNTISQFQALTTRARDRMPINVAKSLDGMISGLEAAYDVERTLKLTYLLKQHLNATGVSAHPNMTFTHSVVLSELLESLLIMYNAMTDPDLLQADFDLIFEDELHLICELLRRDQLNTLNYIEGQGTTYAGTNYYSGSGINQTPVHRQSVVHTFTAGMADVLLPIATAGSSYYDEVPTDLYPIPHVGAIVLSLQGFSNIAGADVPFFSLTGPAIELHIDKVSGGSQTFKVRTTIGADPEDIATIDLTSTTSKRCLLVTYTAFSIDVHVLDAGNVINTVNVKTIDGVLALTHFQIHKKIVFPYEVGASTDLTGLSVHAGMFTSAMRLDLLSNGA